ncbi:MAG: heparinase II/III family protein, partial [Planctomycetes bacterium]|nr:heparinase II/III family protein [Planctomycetota bacterium]
MMLSRTGVLAILVMGAVPSGLAKDSLSLLTPAEAQALKTSMQGKVQIPPELADATDEELWDYVPPATLRRAVFLGPTDVGCPVHGVEIFRVGGGFYPWKRSADKPWQVQCPVGGESYPTNDFGAYLKSVMKEKLDTTQPYVDDGTGWVDEKGRRFFFVGYWVFWQRWYDVLKAIRAFTDAYFATDEPQYAHKATVLFCALAEQYPKMDYPKQGVQGCGGMILPWCWENQSVVTPMSECYDRLFPYLKQDGDEALRVFLKTKTDLGPRKQIEQRFIQTVAKTNFTTDMYWSNECDHQLALADLALAWDNNDPADGITTREIIDWLINHGGDDSLEELFCNSTYRDGFPCEGAIGYSVSIAERQLKIAERLQRCGVDLFKEFPRLKHVAGCWIDMTLEDGHCPSIGDSGNVLGSGRPWHSYTFHLAWENYRDPKFAQALWKIKSMRRQPWTPDRTEAFAAVVKEHGERLNHATRNLGGMGLAILESGGPVHPRGLALYYGSPAGGHSHHDRLNIEFFACGQSVMPEMGYPDQWGRKASEFTQNSIGHYSVLVDERGEVNYLAGYLDFIKTYPGVQLVSAHAERGFPGTSLYRRTTALIDVSAATSYVVDLFRVRGGAQHDWCFHLPPVPEWGIEGLTLSPPQDKGTLAGPDIDAGARVPGDHRPSGFNWLTNVQRAQPAATDSWTFLSKASASYPQLRMTMLPGCAQEVILGDFESPRIKVALPRTMKWLLARHRGEAPLSSAFAAVIEACPEAPAVQGVRRLRASGGCEPVAMRIETREFTDTVLSDADGTAAVAVEEFGEFCGRWGFVRHDAEGVQRLVLTNGSRLHAGQV